jgi:hypothetical protein
MMSVDAFVLLTLVGFGFGLSLIAKQKRLLCAYAFVVVLAAGLRGWI